MTPPRGPRRQMDRKRHALVLGRAELGATPGDTPIQDAVRLLAHAIGWLGKRTDEGEIGTAPSAR